MSISEVLVGVGVFFFGGDSQNGEVPFGCPFTRKGAKLKQDEASVLFPFSQHSTPFRFEVTMRIP